MYYILFKHRLMAGINAIYVFLFIAVIYLLQTLWQMNVFSITSILHQLAKAFTFKGLCGRVT